MTESAPQDGSAPVVELEFHTDNRDLPFVRGSVQAACVFDLARVIPRRNGAYAEFFTALGATADDVSGLVDDCETVQPEPIVEYEDATLVEFLTTDDCPARLLAELGALPQTVRASDGEGCIVAEVPATRDASAVTRTFLDAYPEATLVTKREKADVTPPFSASGVRQLLRTHLTERQYEVVETAFEMGYYDWPRRCTGEDVAAALDIASATFAEHVRCAERKLLAVLFERARADGDSPQ